MLKYTLNKLISRPIRKPIAFNTINYKCFSLEQLDVPKFKTNISDDIVTARKQVFWRIRNLGQLELEYVIMRWYEEKGQNFNLEQLKSFSEEVLEMDNPDLNKYFVQLIPAGDSLEYTRQIQDTLK